VLIAIDTSVLVAGTIAFHPFHLRARTWLDAISRGEIDAALCAHGLAEFYGVLTKIPSGLSPADARLATANLTARVRVIPLTTEAYLVAIDRCVARSLSSGAVFDALRIIAAEQVAADAMLTFNPADFMRLANGDRPRIVVPPDPPSLEV
jgi:predicted nucleic acid-binding protein